MLTRRQLLDGGLKATVATVAAPRPKAVWAQTAFPQRPIRLVVGNAPGGNDDLISRLIAERLGKDFGLAVMVENKAGASTTLAGAAVAMAPPDGHTLLCLQSAGINQMVLRDKLPYRLASFAPVIGLGGFPVALVASTSTRPAIGTLAELAAASRSPEGITVASAGVGTMGHLTSMRLVNTMGGKVVHVSYKSNAEALQAVVAGFAQIMVASASELSAHRQEGKLRMLGVASAQRLPNMPDVPTLRELGLPDFDVALWYGFMAPAGTPPGVIARLADGIGRASKDPAFLSKVQPLAWKEDIRTGEALAQFLQAESARWKQVIQANRIVLE